MSELNSSDRTEGRGVWNKAESLIFGEGSVTLTDSSCVPAAGRGRGFHRDKVTLTPSDPISLERTGILPKRYHCLPLGAGCYTTGGLTNFSSHRCHRNTQSYRIHSFLVRFFRMFCRSLRCLLPPVARGVRGALSPLCPTAGTPAPNTHTDIFPVSHFP